MCAPDALPAHLQCESCQCAPAGLLLVAPSQPRQVADDVLLRLLGVNADDGLGRHAASRQLPHCLIAAQCAKTSEDRDKCAATTAASEHRMPAHSLETLCDELHVRPGAGRDAAQQCGDLSVHRSAHDSASIRLHSRPVHLVRSLGAAVPCSLLSCTRMCAKV